MSGCEEYLKIPSSKPYFTEWLIPWFAIGTKPTNQTVKHSNLGRRIMPVGFLNQVDPPAWRITIQEVYTVLHVY